MPLSRLNASSKFEELIEELIHLAAAYPWVGFGLAVVLFVVAAVLRRMGSYYPLFGALAGLFAVLFLIAAGFGSGLRIVKGRRGARANAVPAGGGGGRWRAMWVVSPARTQGYHRR
jgi:hypothetical protein